MIGKRTQIVLRSSALLFAIAAAGLAASGPQTARPVSSTARHERVGAQTSAIEAIYPPLFGRIVAARAFSDGRAMVADAVERALFIVDPKRPTSRQLGRHGDGPGEYRSPALLFALGGDTTLMVDGTNRRWRVLHGEQFVALPDAATKSQLLTDTDLFGIASDGRVLHVRSLGPTRRVLRVPTRGRPEFADSLAIVLVRPDGKADTLERSATKYLGVREKNARINGSSQLYTGILNPLQTNDQAVLFPNGTVAIAHVAPYRVDWRNERGEWLRGPEVNDTPQPLSAKIRRAISDDFLRDDDDKPVFTVADFPDWPRVIPPFGRRSLFAGGDGRLYILRTPIGRDSEQVVDVFDKTSIRVASVRLPKRVRLLSAGANGVLVARESANGEEQLIRLRIVSTPR